MTKKRKIKYKPKVRVWSWESSLQPDGDQIAYAERNVGAFWKPMFHKEVEGIINEPGNWCVCVRVVRDWNKHDYRVDHQVFIIKGHSLNSFEDLYERAREELIAPIKKSDIYDIGWLAESYSTKLPDDNDKWHLKCLNPSYRVTEETKQIWSKNNQGR